MNNLKLFHLQYAFAKGTPRRLFVVRRGPRHGHMHPDLLHHPVILCSRAHTAKWEAGWSGETAWVWERSDATDSGGGFLLTRWNGLDIDYGHIVRSITLPDGTKGAFTHPSDDAPPWSLLLGAVWWSDHFLPQWLAALGVVLAEDEFTLHGIEQDGGACLLGIEGEQKLQTQRYDRRGCFADRQALALKKVKVR